MPIAQYEPDPLQIRFSEVGLCGLLDCLVIRADITKLAPELPVLLRRFQINPHETANESRFSRQLRGGHELEFFHRALCIRGGAPLRDMEGITR
jgi:hypothetical protein